MFLLGIFLVTSSRAAQIEWRIRFALADPAGKWNITVTDVISGVSSSKEFGLDA